MRAFARDSWVYLLESSGTDNVSRVGLAKEDDALFHVVFEVLLKKIVFFSP